MSHKKASKRRRETEGDDDFSPSVVPQKKRSKSQKLGTDLYESPQQNVAWDESESVIRRSSRTPKPKVFDDEETFVIGKTPDVSKPGDPAFTHLVESSLPSTNTPHSTPKPEGSISKKQRKGATSTYDEGHKRETRRSYQDFLKELTTGTETRDEFEKQATMTGQRSGTKNIAKSNSTKRKSEVVGGDVTPKGSNVVLKIKTPKDKGPSFGRTKQETPDEASHKVRSSSRTPVPKRVFSLLEGEGEDEVKSVDPGSPEFERESVELTLPKVRSSSRAHVPKKSFPLLEKDDDLKTKQTTPEQASSKVRTPKLQGSKRHYSEAGEESQQLQSKNTSISEEPSPKVRVSSRGHIPKRTFLLLEDEKALSEIKGDNGVSGKIEEDEKKLPGSTERQRGRVTKESKRQESAVSSDQQLCSKRRLSKEEAKQTSMCDKEETDDLHLPLSVKSSEVPKRDSRSGALHNADVKTPSSSKSTSGKRQSTGGKDDDSQAKLYKHKSKPMKKKIVSADQTHTSELTVASIKAEVEPKLVSGSETSKTPKATKAKSSSKKKQVIESSGKQSPAVNEKALASKQLSSKNRFSFSPSEPSTAVGDREEMSADSSSSDLKGNKRKKLSKNVEEKSDKDEGKGLKKIKKKDSRSSVSEIPEQEHIILKLHLPQSEESTKHKKHHHHHHHHHHHKHKHSSSNEDGSPKKLKVKKAVAKVSDNIAEPDGNQSSEMKKEKKKKKISIKFKGLSSKNIDLEMAADSPGLMQSVKLGATANSEEKSMQQSKELGKEKSMKQSKKSSEAKSEKHSKETIKKKKKSKPADMSSLQSESEHVKLVIKKDKLPSSSKSDEKKKKVPKPTTSQAKVDDQKKKTAPTTTSKKGKGATTPAKTGSSPTKPKVVTSYLLFCKQYRKKIVEENPGLEFTEISKKVGIAWNNLPEEEKEHWRKKAEELRKALGLTSPKAALTPASTSKPSSAKNDKAEPIDLAAHLQLLGESLGTIGACLRVQDPGEVHGSLSVLLDSALCAIAPLLFLTSQVTEMDGCSRKTQTDVLDNLAYLMPGLG